ncbi:flagellar hook-length control protein FliK [Roseovarius sp.]|uniref:flagellar hook-length control protein FliK n=1 Tax=Roseovarius sp. TaxID=1486281 RepID=UPI003BAABAAE
MFSTLNDSILKLVLPGGGAAGPDGIRAAADRSVERDFREVLGSLARAAGREGAGPGGTGPVESVGAGEAADEGDVAEDAEDADIDENVVRSSDADGTPDAEFGEDMLRSSDAGDEDGVFQGRVGPGPDDGAEGDSDLEAAGRLNSGPIDQPVVRWSDKDNNDFPAPRIDRDVADRDRGSGRSYPAVETAEMTFAGTGRRAELAPSNAAAEEGETGRKAARLDPGPGEARLPLGVVDAATAASGREAQRVIPTREGRAPLPTKRMMPEQAVLPVGATQGAAIAAERAATPDAPGPLHGVRGDVPTGSGEQFFGAPRGPLTPADADGSGRVHVETGSGQPRFAGLPGEGDQDRTALPEARGVERRTRLESPTGASSAGESLPRPEGRGATGIRVEAGSSREGDRLILTGRGGGDSTERPVPESRNEPAGPFVRRFDPADWGRQTPSGPVADSPGHAASEHLPRSGAAAVQGEARVGNGRDGTEVPALPFGRRGEPLMRQQGEHLAAPAPGKREAAPIFASLDQRGTGSAPVNQTRQPVAVSVPVAEPAGKTGLVSEPRIPALPGQNGIRPASRDNAPSRSLDGPAPRDVRIIPAGPVPRDAPSTAGPSVVNPVLRSLGSTAEPDREPAAQVHGEAPTVMRATAVTPGTPPPPAPTQGTPPQVMQVSAAIRGGLEGSVDIHLNPAELGKVRILLTPSETGILVNVMADRPETLDLLRRHVDLLAQDFRDIGYDDASFSFGAGGQGEAGGQREHALPEREEAGRDDAHEPVEPPVGPGGRMSGTGRMDLRV